MSKYILAHDLGTTGNKASLYDSDGQLRSSSFFGYRTEYPQVNWAEQNPYDWWEAVCVSTKSLLAQAKVAPEDVACIVFSGQMMGCLPVDKEGRPLRNSIIWADQRSVKQAQYIAERAGADVVYRITGHRASAAYSAAKLLWIRDNQPDIFAQTYKVLHAKDYVVARLTGNFVTDLSDASGMNLYDLKTQGWSDTILEAIELDHSMLPELHYSSDVVGEVLPNVAEEVGSAAGTPVVIGGGDGCCAAVGAGVVREGTAYNYIGSSSWIGLATKEPIFDPAQRTFNWAHLVPDMFSPTGTMQTAGGSYQWTRDNLCLPEVAAAQELGVSPYELMNLQVEDAEPGAGGLIFLPYLLGERSPRWNPNARGAFIGLTMTHTRKDMIRAVLEGITMNLRVILEAFENQGAKIEAIRVIGGGAKSRTWRQLMANIYGRKILRPTLLAEATSMGAAVAGGVGIGIFKDFSVAEKLVVMEDMAEPTPQLKERYDRLYKVFEQTYKALEPVYESIAQLYL